MGKAIFACSCCGRRYENKDVYKCAACGGILCAKYEGNVALLPGRGESLWTFADRLPVGKCFVSLGEGMTPMVRAQRLGKKLGLENLWIKNETCNPSGSFKDRATTVCIAAAKETGHDKLIVASSGNGAASVAAYAARAGMPALLLVPETTPQGKVAQALMHGASVVKVRGDYSVAFSMAADAAIKAGYYNMTTTFINPCALEGYKTMAYEIFLEMGAPDWVILPVGAGPILAAMHQGFLDLKQAGLVETLPQLAAVQASNCAPIARAFLSGEATKGWMEFMPTMASALADPLRGYEEDGDFTVRCIRESGGSAVMLSEEEIADSAGELARCEGIYAEPGGAVWVGGLGKLIEGGLISSSDRVVGVATGHGLKYDYSALMGEGAFHTVERFEQLMEIEV